MESLNSKIKSIINEAVNLKEKYKINGTLDYVAIFTQTSEEYDFYVEQATKIGKIYNENKSGITFLVNEDIETIEGKFKLLKIRKPDKSRTQLGAPDYKVQNYSQFKEQITENENYNITKSSDGFELIELSDPEFDVLLYIPEIPLSEEIKTEDQSSEVNNIFEELKKNLEEEKHRRLQLMADFQNYQRRIDLEKSNWGAIANKSLIQELLEVYDDLQLALDDEGLDIERAKESIKNAQEKLVAASKRAGIEKIDVLVGDEFDKEKMEAVTTVPVQDEEQKNKVIAVISSAYKYVGKEGVLKPAKVVVGK